MPKRLLFASALIIGSAPALPLSAASHTCGDRDTIVARLSEDFQEVRRDGTAAGPSAFYEVFASEDSGTWTILLSGMNGTSCIVAVGDDWRPGKRTLTAEKG